MKSQLGAISLFTLLVVSIFSIPLSTSFSFADSKVPVVILFKDKVSDKELNLIKSKGGEVTKTFTIIHGAAANLPQGAIDALKKNPTIVSVDPDVEFHAIELDADNRIGASQVWTHPTYPSTGNGVRVAILDTGIDTNNQEFGSGRIVACHSEMGNKEPTCEDGNGHGTHVAGIVGAIGVDPAAKGVAPDVKYLSDKVLDKTGSGSLSGIIAGIQWAVSNNAQVISMSLGTSAYSNQIASNCDSWYPTMTGAVNSAVASGVTVVAAAGNSGTSGVGLPACISNTIAVAAVDDNDTIAYFSSIGGSVKDHGISAPGVAIYSSLPGNTYASWSGTSMATPVVTGTIALLLEDNPSLTPAAVKNALFTTACKSSTSPSCPTGPVPNITYGYGRINALASVLSVGPPAAPTVPGAPTGLSASAVSSSQINLSWTAPASNGGAVITGYQIERASPSGGSFSILVVNTGTTSTSYSDTGLVASTYYNYRVSAINSADTGSASNESAATTLAPAGNTVGVDSIGYSISGGKNNDRHLTVSVHVKDNNNNNVGGASVSISLSNSPNFWTATGTTDSNGNAGFTLKNAPSGTYTTTITNVVASGLTWDNIQPLDPTFVK